MTEAERERAAELLKWVQRNPKSEQPIERGDHLKETDNG